MGTGKRLVLVGGGHAHLVTLRHLADFVRKGHEVTVVGPATHHYYSGMGPGMLGSTYSPAEIRFVTQAVVEKKGARFIQDLVTHIDPVSKTVYLQTGGTLAYDVLSFNAGSYVSEALVREDRGDIFAVKPIEKLLRAQQRIVELCAQRSLTIGIVGGGPSSAEIAGNILQLTKLRHCQPPRLVICCGAEFLGGFPAKVRRLVQASLLERGVEIREQQRVTAVESGKISCENGEILEADLIFLASGVRPSPIFARSGLPTGPDGGLLVNRFLQCPDYPELFGGGDCIYFADQPLAKVGVYAVRENPVLYHNIAAALNGGALRPFTPGGAYLLIFNLGEGRGLLHKSWLTLEGKSAFLLKDYIDRKFMKRFQALEK